MLAYANWAAKAVVAFAIPFATLAVDIASEVAGVTEDGIINLTEWQALALAVLTAFAVFIKANGEDPAITE